MKQKLNTSRSTLAKIIFLVVFLSVLLALYVVYDEWNLRQNIASTQAANTQIQDEIAILETQDQIGSLFAAQQILNKAERVRPEWSKVVAEVMLLETSTEGLEFERVNIDPRGTVLVSGTVLELKNISVLINRLRTRDNFSGPFVPSVSGTNGNFSFQIQFNYDNL